jgi:short chain dehydrogenase
LTDAERGVVPDGQLRPTRAAGLGEDPGQVLLDRVHPDEQAGGDLPVGQPLRREVGDVPLPRRQLPGAAVGAVRLVSGQLVHDQWCKVPPQRAQHREVTLRNPGRHSRRDRGSQRRRTTGHDGRDVPRSATADRLVLPQLRERHSGAIVQVTSMGRLLAFAGVGAYCAAKGVLEQASEALAAEVAPLGIRVLGVEPGAFRTSFAGPTLRMSTRIADYDNTAVQTHTGLVSSHDSQDGDPDKAASAVLAALDFPTPPLRLALGADAVAAIRAKLAP